MTACYEAVGKENNREGRCCCNCRWQKPIVKHPWNTIEMFKGRVTEQIAFGCTVPDMGAVVLSEREHSLCEMHDWNGAKK